MSWERRVVLGAIGGAAALSALLAADRGSGPGPLVDLELQPGSVTTAPAPVPTSGLTTSALRTSTSAAPPVTAMARTTTTVRRRTTTTRRPASTTTTLQRVPGATVGGPATTTTVATTTTTEPVATPGASTG